MLLSVCPFTIPTVNEHSEPDICDDVEIRKLIGVVKDLQSLYSVKQKGEERGEISRTNTGNELEQELLDHILWLEGRETWGTHSFDD